jgi:nucleoside-diphosphate-sugar epimerase
METALVTGGRGRSGRWLCDRLAGDHRVVCLDLDHPGWEVEERDRVTFRAVDATDAGEVVEAYFGRLPDDCTLAGHGSTLSTAKAAELFGCEPAHGWREAADAVVDEPSLLAE